MTCRWHISPPSSPPQSGSEPDEWLRLLNVIMPYSLYFMKNQREWYHNNSPKKGLRSHMVNKGSNTVNIILLLWKQGKHKGWNSFSRYKIFESDTLLWSSSSLSTAYTAVLSASSLKHWIQSWSSAITSRHTQSVFVYISPMNCNSHHRTYCHTNTVPLNCMHSSTISK